MNHDPLCPNPLAAKTSCHCDLIARVRVDEASKNIGTVSLGELAKAQEHTYNAGYAAALDAARNAVAEMDWSCDERQLDLPVVGRGDALAAIDALKGEAHD